MRSRDQKTKRAIIVLFVAVMLSPGLASAICTVGYNSPSANAADTTSGDFNGYEITPPNAYIAEPVPAFAVDNNSGATTSTSCTSNKKDRHSFYDFGFNLPTDARILGIELQLKAKVDDSPGSPMICAQFSWNGGSNWTTAKSTPVSTTNQAYILGGPTDTWGHAWTPTEINDTNNTNNKFRVRLIDVASNNSRDFFLDSIGVKVCTDVKVSFNTDKSSGSENLLYSDISVSLSTASTQTVTVNWAVAPPPASTATNGTDYIIPIFTPPFVATSGTLSFAPGEVRKTIRVNVAPDNVAEPDETVKLNLSCPCSNATLGSITSHTFTIYNNTLARGIAGDFTADVVLGQFGHTESTTNKVVANHAFNVGGVVVDRGVLNRSDSNPAGRNNGRAYVWDGGNNRILGFDLDDSVTACEGYPNPVKACSPVLVIGQPSGSGYGSCNQDASMSRYPYLAPASASTLCGMPAWYISPKEKSRRSSMAVDQTTGDLYVPDFENNRILIYNNPFNDGSSAAIADDVIGQDDFSGVYCNKVEYQRTGNGDGATTPTSNPTDSSLCAMSEGRFSQSLGVALDAAGNLWVADGGNNRVLRFPKLTATNPTARNKIRKTADLVLGQPNNFTSRTFGAANNQMHSPTSLAFGPDGKLYVADGLNPTNEEGNARILVFTPDPITKKFTSGMGGTPFAGDTVFNLPYIAAGDLSGLWISSFVPGTTSVQQRYKVEQYNWNGSIARPLPLWESGLENSFDASVDVDKLGNVLIPASRDNHDLVIYKASNYSYSTLLPPPGVFNTTTSSSLLAPAGIATAQNQLYVADVYRILIWNNLDQIANGEPAITDGKPADSFIGQRDLYSQDYLFDGDKKYWQIKVDSLDRLWVTSNDRIIVYQAPLYTWSKPIKVITPPLRALDGTEIPHINQGNRELGIAPMTVDGKEFLWIAQPFQHRVLRLRSPLGPDPRVDMVLGQLGLNEINDADTKCNRYPGLKKDEFSAAPVASSDPNYLNVLCAPYNLSVDPSGDLYVSDHISEGIGNKRMMIFGTSNTVMFPTANTSVMYAPNAFKVFPQQTFEAAFYKQQADHKLRMVVGYDSYGNDPPYMGIYDNPSVSGDTTPVCTHPGESDCYLNDHMLNAAAATFDSLGNLYVADVNRAKVFVYKQLFEAPNPGLVQGYPAMTTVSSHIVASSDAAYNCGGSTINNSSIVTVGKCTGGIDAKAGLRFTDINIPKTATIRHAVIIFKPKSSNYNDPLTIRINGAKQPNLGTFSTAPTALDLEQTVKAVYLDDGDNGPWKSEHWHVSPELKDIVREIMDHANWASGSSNSMTFLINNIVTPNDRSFIGFDSTATNYAPTLHIQYY